MIRVPLSWLREYVAVEASPEEIAERLTVSTCEVERIVHRGVADQDGNLGHFLVGRVVDADKHPNADRLQLCRVDVGEREPRQIVCGAWNFGAGATVAVALPGAVLPGGEKLERAELRGEFSDGMILSERELELGTDHAGILVLDEGPAPGTPLAEVLPLADDVLEIETTPNRPDLLAVYGIAREVAALFDVSLSDMPGCQAPGPVPQDEKVDVRVDDLEGCPRYIGRVFRDVKVGPSPTWLKARLVAAGMRPVSNVVDVTNYVMHVLGNPLHAFDQAKLAERRIVVRRAAKGEEARTLDDNLRHLGPGDLVIADAERTVAIAGIMGSLETEVDESTIDVLLEAANFEPVSILKTSERLGLRTDGSNRWEKGVDPYLAEPAANLATQLIVELSGARWTGHTEVLGELPERPVIELRPACTSALLGLELGPERQQDILRHLRFDVDDGRVTVPTWRARDVTREVDLVEEVGRFVLDEVPHTLPQRDVFGRLTPEQKLRRLVEDALVGAGLSEAYTSSLVAEDPDPDALRLPVPLSTEQAVLRTTLLPSLVEAAQRNLDAGNEGIALFEIAVAYLPSGDKLPNERTRVAAILQGDFLRAKGVVEALYDALKIDLRVERETAPPQLLHPGKTARLGAGLVGELVPGALEGAWSAFELDLGELVATAPELVVYDDVITYPGVRQDLAFAVDEAVAAGELIAAARGAAGPELREIRVFDVYHGEQVGEGRKSVAFAVLFQSRERTLSDEDAAALRKKIADALARQFGAELRSA